MRRRSSTRCRRWCVSASTVWPKVTRIGWITATGPVGHEAGLCPVRHDPPEALEDRSGRADFGATAALRSSASLRSTRDLDLHVEQLPLQRLIYGGLEAVGRHAATCGGHPTSVSCFAALRRAAAEPRRTGLESRPRPAGGKGLVCAQSIAQAAPTPPTRPEDQRVPR
jgi:hypothetical protein